jgi:hypothetical protein
MVGARGLAPSIITSASGPSGSPQPNLAEAGVRGPPPGGAAATAPPGTKSSSHAGSGGSPRRSSSGRRSCRGAARGSAKGAELVPHDEGLEVFGSVVPISLMTSDEQAVKGTNGEVEQRTTYGDEAGGSSRGFRSPRLHLAPAKRSTRWRRLSPWGASRPGNTLDRRGGQFPDNRVADLYQPPREVGHLRTKDDRAVIRAPHGESPRKGRGLGNARSKLRAGVAPDGGDVATVDRHGKLASAPVLDVEDGRRRRCGRAGH